MSTIPFVEKYRPSCMDDIILNNINKTIINNIIKNQSYPNLLLYGPPGTGKTTTVINLVKKIQNSSNKSLLLHLNASDERGIDTIRNQITRFINSKPLFSSGIKFIILDEVDYMTKSAQLALKYLLQQYNNKAVFCLMCNYISKIESTLKSEFIELKFNKLPKENIVLFLKEIARK
jgi:replication factor C subunit 3/5